MKSVLAIMAVSFVVCTTAPAFAQSSPPAPTRVDCEKMADKKWDDGSKTCLPK